MKPTIRVAFRHFWPTFTPDIFKARFPYVYEKYNIVTSDDPEVIFYSVFHAPPKRRVPRLRRIFNSVFKVLPKPDVSRNIPQGKYVRVFFTGENIEPRMAECEFAMSFSRLISHPNHLRLPLWIYEGRNWGLTPEHLVKPENTDWEKVAAEKTEFCNFVYGHSVPFRNSIFSALTDYKRVDAAGLCMNNMDGWRVPKQPNWHVAKIKFLQHYKFTLAIENFIWPGYCTEKLVDPLFVNSIPLYFGDPMLRHCFNPASYIDFSGFSSMKETLDRIREVDNDRKLYMEMLSAPFFLDNRVPKFAQDATILTFFDRIFAAAQARSAACRIQARHALNIGWQLTIQLAALSCC